MALSSEKQLALKISITSFFVLIFILGSIIFSSYIYTRNRAYADFMNEHRTFDTVRLIGDDGMVLQPLIAGSTIVDDDGNKIIGPRKGPRDILVFDKQRNAIKNEVLTLDSGSIDKLFSLMAASDTAMSIGEKYFLVARENIGDYTFFLLHDLTPVLEFHEQLLVLALIGGLLGLLVIFVMSNHLAKITIAPIREHNKELESYSHNVAHELRTPLAVMRQNLELLRLKPAEKLITSTDEEISNMERIIETLLFLAKPDEEKSKKEKVNLTKEIEGILECYDGSVEFPHTKKAVTIVTHRELLKRVIINLVDNAIKYKAEGKVEIKTLDNSFSINNAIAKNFTEQEISNLTKAFYQGDVSRSSSGYGLGLALVAKIIEIEGWKMDIQGKDKKFVVKITF